MTGVQTCALPISTNPSQPTIQNVTSHLGTITLDRETNTPFTAKLSAAQQAVLAAEAGHAGQAITSLNVTEAKEVGNNTGEFVQTLAFTIEGVNNTIFTTTVTAKFASQQGTPYFYNTKNNTVISNGDTVTMDKFANGFTAAQLLSDIKDNYGAKTSDASNSDAEIITTASDIESQLVAQEIGRAHV